MFTFCVTDATVRDKHSYWFLVYPHFSSAPSVIQKPGNAWGVCLLTNDTSYVCFLVNIKYQLFQDV